MLGLGSLLVVETQISLPMDSYSKYIAIGMILLGIGLSTYVGIHTASGAKVYDIGIVLVDNLEVKSEPGKHGFLQKRLAKGTRVKIIKRHRRWLQILHGGEVGFIHDEPRLVQIIPQKETRTKKHRKAEPGSTERRIEGLKKRAKDVEHKIEEGESKIRKYSQAEIDIINQLNEVDVALNKSNQRLAALMSEVADYDEKIAATTKTSSALDKQLKANEKYVARRLIALYKLHRIGQIHVLASATTMHEFLQRKEALERILAQDAALRQNLVEYQLKLKNVLTELENHKTEKSMLLKTVNHQLNQISNERSERAKLLVRIRSQKSLELAALDSWKKSAKQLDQKIHALNKKQNSTSNLKTSEKPITAYKGLLKMPVKGKIINLFGPYKNKKFNIINFRSGIDIATEKGEPVKAVYSGKIIYARWFNGYGNMIIIDHGNNYYTLYAHVEKILKITGERIETGDVIATVGETGSMSGPKLHFEVRHHGKPQDPLNWLNRG
jgi:septal ring factor EnvC (AmiA/AmiB activator)